MELLVTSQRMSRLASGLMRMTISELRPSSLPMWVTPFAPMMKMPPPSVPRTMSPWKPSETVRLSEKAMPSFML